MYAKMSNLTLPGPVDAYLHGIRPISGLGDDLGLAIAVFYQQDEAQQVAQLADPVTQELVEPLLTVDLEDNIVPDYETTLL